MDDLQAVTQALVDNSYPHRVSFDYSSDHNLVCAEVFAGWIHGRFKKVDGCWELVKGTYDRRTETITGLLASIREIQ